MSRCEREVRRGAWQRAVAVCLESHQRTGADHDLVWAAKAYLSLGEFERAEGLARRVRVVNRIPYTVNANDPSIGWQLGGAMFCTETHAADDDIPSSCPSGTWRHRYWRITGSGDIATDIFTIGCVNWPLFCRRRT